MRSASQKNKCWLEKEVAIWPHGSILMETASVGGKTDTFYVQTHSYGTAVISYLSVTDFNDARVATLQGDDFHHIALVYIDWALTPVNTTPTALIKLAVGSL